MSNGSEISSKRKDSISIPCLIPPPVEGGYDVRWFICGKCQRASYNEKRHIYVRTIHVYTQSSLKQGLCDCSTPYDKDKMYNESAFNPIIPCESSIKCDLVFPDPMYVPKPTTIRTCSSCGYDVKLELDLHDPKCFFRRVCNK